MNAATVKRLLIDLNEIKQNPLTTVSAAPLDDNLFIWHANVMGIDSSPYAGAIFHIELQFPDNYPESPPSVKVLTPIPHPHVHGDKVCLDLLSDFDGYFKRSASTGVYHTGWSSAYSVLSILLQLQAFLLEIDEEEELDVEMEEYSSSDENDGEGLGKNLEELLVAIPGLLSNLACLNVQSVLMKPQAGFIRP